MKYNILNKVQGLRGVPLMIADKDGAKEATYADLLLSLASSQEPDAKRSHNLSRILFAADQATEAYLGNDGILELSAEQVSHIKEVAPKVLTPVAYGRLADFLESPISSVTALRAGGTD